MEKINLTLTKVGFTFAGKIEGLDDNDPELFYYKKINKKHNCNNRQLRSIFAVLIYFINFIN